MSFTLRPYQEQAVDLGAKALMGSSVPGIEVLPSGSGKSLVIANIVKRLDGPCIVFQPSKEILEQNYAKLVAYGEYPSVFSASLGKKQIGDITLATIGSVIRRLNQFKYFRYVIMDECHLTNAKGGMYETFLSSGDYRILGLTASPYRMVTDGFGGTILKFLTRTRPRIFEDVVYYVQNKELFDAGYLAKLEYYPVKGFNRGALRYNSTGADFTDESVLRHFKSINFADRVVDVIQRLLKAGRKNILVFTRFVHESQQLIQAIPEAQMVSATSTDKEREEVIGNFRSGKTKVVCNVSVLSVGFDYPELETVVLARPTLSLGLYYQMLGRCVRPHPEKQSAWIVDMCENQKMFGKIEDLHLDSNGGVKWIVTSNGRQLTNIYYGDRKPVHH